MNIIFIFLLYLKIIVGLKQTLEWLQPRLRKRVDDLVIQASNSSTPCSRFLNIIFSYIELLLK